MGDVADLLTEALTHGQYLDSEWCLLGSNNCWAACDSYTVVRSEFVQHSHAAVSVKYFIKFAVGKTGKVLLLVSSHLS